MKKSDPHDEGTRTLVKLFCSYVLRLKTVRHMFRELFEANDAQALTQGTADAFFFDLSNILADYWLLEAAKLTDPSTSGGNENFTIANLIETVDWSPDCVERLNALNKTVLAFRGHIKVTRDKLLAHYDKETVISDGCCDSFPADEDQKLLDALEEACNVMHVAAFGNIVGDMVVEHLGDVSELKDALKKVIAFDKLFSNSKGEEKARLRRLWQESGTARRK